MMGKTSSIVKDRYNKKVYDEIKIRIPKGEKATLQEYLKATERSLNSFIVEAVHEKINKETVGEK